MGYLIRALIAAIGCVLAFAIISPFCNVIGFHPSADLFQIIKICIAGIAIFYVLRGGPSFPWINA